MKKQTKQTACITLAVLTILGIWLRQNIQAQKERSAGASPVQTLSRFEQSETGAGTLTVVRNSKGEEIFGKTLNTNEGYSIAYQIQGPLPKKQKASPIAVFATANNHSKDLLICEKCSQKNRELQQIDPNAAVATAVTSDHALMITSSFKFDPTTERLAVHRIIENISNDPEVCGVPIVARTVKLLSVLLQYHSRLWSGIPPQAGIPKWGKHPLPSAPPKGKSFISNFLPVTGLAVTSSCGFCPTQCELSVDLKPSSVTTLCVSCPGKYDKKDKIYHEFMNGIVSPGNDCPNPIVMGGFASSADILVPDGQQMLTCVKCDPGFWVTSILNTGQSAVDTFESWGCQLKIYANGVSALHPNGRPNNRPAFTASAGFMQTDNRMRAQTAQGKLRYKFAALPASVLKPGERIEVVTVYSLK